MQKHKSESRTEDLIMDLLRIQGWQTDRPPKGSVIRKNEYKDYPSISKLFASKSKTGKGDGFPDFLIVDPASNLPLIVIEAKSEMGNINKAIAEADHYANACFDAGIQVVSIGIAGQDRDGYKVEVHKAKGSKWATVVYNKAPISWIPTLSDVKRLISSVTLFDLTPVVPGPKVLAEKADVMNRILREATIKDEYRPAYVAAMMLALWHTNGNIRKDQNYILSDINKACSETFKKAQKHDLSNSIHVDESNLKLASSAWEIVATLEKLNVATASMDHDYLGHLYESFFRYTGGNTIGQYFTPRQICRFMVDACSVRKEDIVIDPACGTGGFLIGALQRACDLNKLKYEDVVAIVRHKLIGFESEPLTASLCIANMILRGDGKSGIKSEDCFVSKNFPIGNCDISLMNPPFPHKKTDTPPIQFVERALEALKDRGKLAVILPTSTVVKREFDGWRENILRKNTLLAVCELPDEVFQPFASTTTCVIMLEKGVPHNGNTRTVFVRIEKDGLELKKGVRVPRRDEINQIPDAVNAIHNKLTQAGFSGAVNISGGSEWSPGAYIPSSMHSPDNLKDSVDELLRRWLSFYTMYSPQISKLRALIETGDLTPISYDKMISSARVENASQKTVNPGTIGAYFNIYYGQKELHSRGGFAPGDCLIISPTEQYNGTYGWLEFDKIIEAPFATVAQTGSIGEAFVQTECCGVNDDCLILMPKCTDYGIPHLFLAAAIIRLEKWRFSYGRKLTPERIKDFPMLLDKKLINWIQREYNEKKEVAESALSLYPATL